MVDASKSSTGKPKEEIKSEEMPNGMIRWKVLGSHFELPAQYQVIDPVGSGAYGVVVAAIRLPALHGALDRMIESVERELGAKLSDLSRTAKQRAIRLLDERGAFTLRRAVEDVADSMGVSRITVYNYLNSLHR